MPPRTTPPLLRQGTDEGKTTPAFLIGLRFPGCRPISVRVGDLHPQPSVIAGNPHADLTTDRQVVLLENFASHAYLESREDTVRLSSAFDHLRASALSALESEARIVRIAEELTDT
ncbi:Scr1 family TA system antitoxin-like transcriptional regulator [Streptomyces acidicola]|uniref:Scr1 family TA system antitoxin-like transcriptional regulator n=1 Tax=Streptomyces acidicola TaxID=2596892 RepID=UPI003899BC67